MGDFPAQCRERARFRWRALSRRRDDLPVCEVMEGFLTASDIPDVDPRWIASSETRAEDGREVREEIVSARGFYRIAWRRMAANTGEPTLIPAITPPGTAHAHPVHTFGLRALFMAVEWLVIGSRPDPHRRWSMASPGR